MIAELEKAYRLAESEAGAWNQIEIVIHEWHESAKAIASPELAAAFSDEIDEILLTPPPAYKATNPTPAKKALSN